MIWQDLVISIGQFMFAAAMIPTIRSSSKPALVSSAITAAGLSVFAATFTTLDLWLSVAGTATGAAVWWCVAYQSWALRRPPRERHIKLPRNKFTESVHVNDCECLIECDGVASLATGEVCRAARLRWMREYNAEQDDALIKGSTTTQHRGILSSCQRGLDVDCALPSGHLGDCVSASRLPRRAYEEERGR